MGKVKSAIITALIVTAVVVLSLFATISCPLGEVERYNSFISAINMGGDITGEAYAMLYPEGVISDSDYKLLSEDDKGDYTQHGGLYVETDKHGDEFKESVKSDADILNARFGEKGYSKYSVSVVDDYAIKVTVPTNFNYAEFTGRDESSAQNKKTLIGNTVNYLTLSGGLDLRSSSTGSSKDSLISIKTNFAEYFKGIGYTAVGGNHYVRLSLTDEGFEKLNAILIKNADTTGYFFVGDTCLQLQVTGGESLPDKTLTFSVGESYAKDFSIILNSVVTGNVLTNEYNDNGADTEIVTLTPAFGEYAFVWLFVLLLLVVIGAIVASVLKYKKLGWVNALIIAVYALVLIIALLLTGIQLTIGGAFTAVLGLALLTFTNFAIFEAVRKETLLGRTLQASVKTGYKKSLFSVLDLHVVLVVVSILLATVCAGELASCGFILFIATVASYVLHWFTRFMWFVISSPVKDKFKFCGFKREVLDDED